MFYLICRPQVFGGDVMVSTFKNIVLKEYNATKTLKYVISLLFLLHYIRKNPVSSRRARFTFSPGDGTRWCSLLSNARFLLLFRALETGHLMVVNSFVFI